MAGNKVYPMGQCYKTFFYVIKEWAKQARLFVPRQTLQTKSNV
jgi:hypothetical protein